MIRSSLVVARERTIRARTDTIRYEYSSIQDGRYRYEYSLRSQPPISLYQAGRLENAAILRNGWHTPSKTKHVDH